MISRLPALQHRDFRLLWGGGLISTIGSQMQLIAVNWHTYQLLQGHHFQLSLFGNSLSVNVQALGLGALGAVRILPIFLFALLGGALADRYDRRSLVIGTQITAALCAGLLALITITGHISLALLYIFTALDASVSAFEDPAHSSLFPELVPEEHLPNATTLYSLHWTVGIVAGPALASLLIGFVNIGSVYLINALSFLAVVLATLLLHYRARTYSEKTTVSRKDIVEGLSFVTSTPLIWSTMMLDCVATFFASARTMLPLVADQLLHTGVQGYGLLATAQPIGALLTGLLLTLGRPSRRQGVTFLLSVALYGLATALFGLSTSFAISYLLFALTGVGDTISTIIRSTIRQQWTPPAFRGRVNSVQMIVAFGGPQIGEVEAGILAALCGVSLTIFSGGLITLLFVGYFAWRYPLLRRYREKTLTLSSD